MPSTVADRFSRSDSSHGTDNNGCKQTVLASNRALLAAQRELFRSEFAREIEARGESYWKFPYVSLSKAIVAYEQTKFGLIGDRDATAYVSEGVWKSFKAAHKKVRSHFTSTLTAARGGKLLGSNGAAPFTAQVEGDVLEVDLSTVIAKLDMSGLTVQDLFEDYVQASLFLTDQDGKPGAKRRALRKERWQTTLIWGSEPGDGEVHVWAPSTGDLFVVMYLVLHMLCVEFGCAQTLQELYERRLRTSHPRTKATKTAFLAADDASRRLFGRGDDCLTQADYVGEAAISLYANNKSGMVLKIENDMSLDDAFEAYRLDFEDQFWHEMVWTLAYNDGNEPLTTIRGSDIIRQAGYSNPYCEGALPLYARSLKRIDKLMTKNRVAIETDPKRNKPKGVKSSYMFQPIIDGKPELLSFEDASTDYVIHLNVPVDGNALDALPLARFATETGEVIRAMRKELEFPGLRLNFEHRMMWRYCLQRAKQRKTNRKILFETMFRNIGLDGADRYKKARMLAMLRKMLDERQSGGQLTYEWHTEEGEKSAYGVTILLEEKEPLPNEEKKAITRSPRTKGKD